MAAVNIRGNTNPPQAGNNSESYEFAVVDAIVEASDFFRSVDYRQNDGSQTRGALDKGSASVQFYADGTNTSHDNFADFFFRGVSIAAVMSEYTPPYFNSFFTTDDPTYHAQLPKINVNVGNSCVWHKDPADWEEVLQKQDINFMPFVSPMVKTRALNVGKFWSGSHTTSNVTGISFPQGGSGVFQTRLGKDRQL
jgi:hypothetical protein